MGIQKQHLELLEQIFFSTQRIATRISLQATLTRNFKSTKNNSPMHPLYILLPLLPLLTPVLANPADATFETGGVDVMTHSDCTITVYTDVNCSKGKKDFIGKIYGKMESYPDNFRSYKLSRALRSNERLDFSTSEESKKAGPMGVNNARIMDAGIPPNSCKLISKSANKAEDR